MQENHRLRMFGSHRHETCTRSADRLADGRRIGSVILPTFVQSSIKRDQLRRHQSDRVAKPLELSRQEMRAGSGFYANHVGRNSGDNAEQFLPVDLLPRQNRLTECIDGMDSENLFCRIDTNSHNRHKPLPSKSERNEL